MTRVSVAVMAHPARARLVADVVARLDVEPTVVVDRHSDRWDTGRRALLAGLDTGSTLHVVVQDDAVVCPDLAAGVARLAEQVPAGHPIGLYLGKGMPRSATVARLYRRAKQLGFRWVAMERSPFWGVALALPTQHLAGIVDRGDRLRTPVYDGRIANFYRKQVRRPCWYPVPSLVDHRDKQAAPSLLWANERGGRVAHEFIGQDASPLDVDWATPAVHG